MDQVIRIGDVELQPQVMKIEESWYATLLVERYMAKGNLRHIMQSFAGPEYTGGPGQAYVRRASFRRTADGDFVFRQSGGLDI